MSALLSPAPVRPRRALHRSELLDLIAKLADDPRAWQAQARHDPRRRWWTRIVSDATVDVWLITWPGREATDLHDHGSSAAALTVVRGTLEHVLASRSGELARDSLRAGTLLSVEPGAVHDVRNASRVPAVSIHAYSPPLEQMTYYRRRPGGLDALRTVRSNEPELDQPW